MLRIISFEQKGNAFLNLDDDVHWITGVDRESPEEEGYYSDDSDADAVPEEMPETKALALPLSWLLVRLSSLGWTIWPGRKLHYSGAKLMMRSKV